MLKEAVVPNTRRYFDQPAPRPQRGCRLLFCGGLNVVLASLHPAHNPVADLALAPGDALQPELDPSREEIAPLEPPDGRRAETGEPLNLRGKYEIALHCVTLRVSSGDAFSKPVNSDAPKVKHHLFSAGCFTFLALRTN